MIMVSANDVKDGAKFANSYSKIEVKGANGNMVSYEQNYMTIVTTMQPFVGMLNKFGYSKVG